MARQGKHLIFLESLFFSTGFEMCQLAKNLGYMTTLICRDLAFYLKGTQLEAHPLGQADFVIETETNDSEHLIKVLEEYNQKNPFDGIVTFSDYYVDIAAIVACHFGLPAPTPQATHIAHNKDLTRAYLQKAGVPSPRFFIVEQEDKAIEAAKAVGYPCIVKPVVGTGSQRVTLVANEEELLEAFVHIRRLEKNDRGQMLPGKALIEEYMWGEEISVETLSDRKNCYVLGITSKGLSDLPYFAEIDFSFPYLLPSFTYEQTVLVAKAALQAIGYTNGSCHIEIKLTSQGPKVVEINPRVGGTYFPKMIYDAVGIHPLQEAMKLAVGENVELAPQEARGTAFAHLMAPATGYVKEITGIDDIAGMKGIEFIALNIRLGDLIHAPKSNVDCIGYIYAIGNSAEEALKTLRTAREKLHIVVEKELSLGK